MKTFKKFVIEAGDYWHPDPEQDRKSPEDYSKKLKPGETYTQFAKRKAAGG